MKMFIRKDIAAKIWNYGSLPVAQEPVQVDPYQGKITKFKADLAIGAAGSAPGQFQAPRGMAAAADGSIYVADSRNNRIQHFNAQGELLDIWGTFADISKGAAPGGTFNEPWGIAVGPDGSVYVTDTWNHRVEKFTAKGEFIKMWGTFGQGETPTAFWGPRGLAVDGDGKVFVTDTGNKRIVVFNSEGLFITQFGTSGVDAGQFDEPVGLALDKSGKVYVNDTWNQRVQVFEPSADKLTYSPVKQWAINGWFGQSLDNKPFIAVEANGNVLVTDPEGYRVLEFDSNGAIIRGWGDYSPDVDGFGLASGVAVAPDGKVWVSDGANNRLLKFTLP
jgi:DNA-binding beta-propeller fold protein YncE